MDVIGAGFGRTGTLSLKIALERLGFGPCAHMVPLLEDEARAELWLRAAQGERDRLPGALDGYRSTVDWPGAYFWRDLVERYPAAKVVLTVRDPKDWYESMEQTIFRAVQNRPPGVMATFRKMVFATVWDGTFQGGFTDVEETIAVFEEHNAAVRREVPAERLLEFEVRQGWSPLCDFLGVPVPVEEFPRANDRQAFRERVEHFG